MKDAAPIAQKAPLAEFTAKAVVTGVVLGLVFGAANAYLGLRVGMTVSASIPAAVMTVAVFRLLRPEGDDSRGQPLADHRVGVDGARHRQHLHAPGAVPLGDGAAVSAGGGVVLPGRRARPGRA
ncbi:MAG: OPT/YSL family transporter [Anaerotruncus sp.]|nr:OPT/YSL family transporter [Anaerotruncus sp.]